ncbi:hypothetical protein N7519_006527 [Penicillium mononematosum]|uniref:uncharacterized protein n=1 Tax=Penicillium mononematosum TaxID=268346 RepID=UPI002547BAA6|nr:uncharacterized protein N7519_006527 [Penicillium mononematosum]KAJ6185226.1 hypothetical protein N7519_006527 [Penicillium mononematosum]
MTTSTSPTQAQIFPGKGLGFITLGASLHNVLTRVKSYPQTYPAIDLAYSPADPLRKPVVLQLPSNGLRFRFDGPDQRLRLIEVLDFSRVNLVYKNQEVLKGGKSAEQPLSSHGPSFRHVYNRLFGPSYPGEYVPPADPQSPYGTYVLSYPGVAFSFPLQHSAWSDQCDFVALLSSSAALPATSMSIFQGSSWPEVRAKLFTQQAQYPRSSALIGKSRESLADEIEEWHVLGAGKLEVVRRTGSPLYITLGETTPQDLIADFGPPDAIYRKNDRRISIHRAAGGGDLHLSPSPGRGIEIPDGDHSSTNSVTDDSDEEMTTLNIGDPTSLPAECFFNYFHHGFDAFISYPTTPGPAFPDSGRPDPSPQPPSSQLTVTKIILHGNVPGSYPFNRHRRSRWLISLDESGDCLTSESPYDEISERLRTTWKGSYASPAEERALQRPMVLNRGWGESPESSVEFLGGWEETTAKDLTSYQAYVGIRLFIYIIAARTLKALDQRRPTVLRLETEPSSCHNALPHNVKSIIVKRQKDGWAAEFQREKEAYRTLEYLQGTVIPQLFGEGSLNGIPALILSEVAGSTVSELPRNGVEVREDMLQSHLKEALSVLNQYGAEYSDLRPDNFMICDNGSVVILDLEDVSFSWKPEESAFDNCGNLGDAAYLMSKSRDIRDPNRPSTPVPPILKSVNEEKRQYFGPYTVPDPSKGSCYIAI